MILSRGVKSLLNGLDKPNSTLSGVNSPLDFIEVLKEFSSSKSSTKKNLLVLPTEDECERFLTKASSLNYVFLPSYSSNPYSSLLPNSNIAPERLHFLNEVLKDETSYDFFITHPAALLYKTITPSKMKLNSKTFEFADVFFKDPTQDLINLGYTPSQFVEKPGQFSDKGGIIDVFSPAHKHPHRIELFGNEIESLHSFSVKTQRTLNEEKNITLIPSSECFYNEYSKTNLLKEISSGEFENDTWKKDSLHKIRNLIPFEGKEFLIPLFWKETKAALDYFLPQETNLFFFDKNTLDNSWTRLLDNYSSEYQLFKDSESKSTLAPDQLFETPVLYEKFKNYLNICPVLVSDLKDFSAPNNEDSSFSYSTTDLTKAFKKIKSSSQNWSEFSTSYKKLFQDWKESKHTVFISCTTQNSRLRVKSFLTELSIECFDVPENDIKKDYQVYIIDSDTPSSTKYSDDQVIYIKQEDLLGKSSSAQVTKQKKAHEQYFDKLDLLQISELQIEDLVVHVNHGIGLFKGLKTIELQGLLSECIEIHYAGKDKLFLPVHKINQIRKYSSNKSSRSLDKLGGAYWQKTKSKVKSKLKDIAEELVQLYAKRKQIKRPPLEIQTKDFTLFQNQFPFDETPDQLTSIQDVCSDFEKSYPMDRLICGDVGFGKTEVAMRSAFIALSEGKQVAVLAPTTVLSLQHLNSFIERFKHWPFEIRGLNRFITKKNVQETLGELKEGKVDLLIGTHRILSSDVQFKNLGLLIVDEEQKFGVKQKEKIKSLKNDVDILSMSATPIPRTLNMGFLGVRDLSLISTPPKDRLPIKTFISHFNTQVIKQAVDAEVARGGQVYFVHNRVQSIYQVHDQLKELFPNLRIGLGHGQMSERELENIIVKFFNKEIDVLLSTTIIESGIDISSANTMIINNAQNLGLSQLYQLRGRVGRSEQRSFCYLLIPPNRNLESEQKEKLKVLQDNTQLGSGLQIAHHDLEIRGAGNLLGEAQSGHADEIGYDFYIELLEEAISESRGDEQSKKVDPEINVPLPALIPSDYIKDLKTRLYYYRKLNKVKSESDLDQIENEMSDQFGKVPSEVIGLFFLSATKNICKGLGIKDLKSGLKNISLQFIEKPNINHDVLLTLINEKSKKYTFSAKQRLVIQKENPQWSEIYNEITQLSEKISL